MHSPIFTSSVYYLGAVEDLTLDYTKLSKEISLPIDIVFDKSCSLAFSKLNRTKNVSIVEEKVSLKYKF